MKVFVLIEWTGNSAVADGADILGVYTTREGALSASKGADKQECRKRCCIGHEVQEHEVQEI